MSLNRYAYNAMAHLASLHGALDDALMLYGMMKDEARRRRQQTPPPPATASARGAQAGEDDAARACAPGEAAAPSSVALDVSPDEYTYSALVRAAAAAGRADLLPSLFNEMIASRRAAEREAGRPRRGAGGGGGGEGEAQTGVEVGWGERGGGASLAVLGWMRSWVAGRLPMQSQQGVCVCVYGTQVWGHFITAATRLSQPRLAQRIFEEGIRVSVTMIQ
jgi:pentatricopeptide repeat protein